MARRSGTSRWLPTVVAAVAVALALGACTGSATADPTGPMTPAPVHPSPTSSIVALRDVAPKGLLVGASVAGGVQGDSAAPLQTDPAYQELLGTQFSSLTPENALKWRNVEPARGQFDFTYGDAVVAFAQQHGEKVRGHNLLWFRSNPQWLTKGDFTPDELRQILHDHITAVVGHYKGKIAVWDVANEVFDQNGQLMPGNPFTDKLGIGIVADAFRWAHEADPDAVLYLNDFNVETSAAKRQAYVNLIQDLKAQGVPIGGMGIQSHLALKTGTFPKDYAKTLKTFGDLGIDVAVTELDVAIPLQGGAATPDQLAKQATWYKQAVRACLAVPRCVNITMWGVPDDHSWVPGYTDQDAATVFADDTTTKPAFDSMVAALQAGRTSPSP